MPVAAARFLHPCLGLLLLPWVDAGQLERLQLVAAKFE
jgi:hypothetical protein